MSLPKVLAISGSIRKESSNRKILEQIQELYGYDVEIAIYESLAELPHFVPNLQPEEIPEIVKEFLDNIATADGIIICTPEYVFSPPAILKNALEWTVAETVLSYKPTVLVVASSAGQKTFETMDLILKTLLQEEIPATQKLLVNGIRAKLDETNQIADTQVLNDIKAMMSVFINKLHVAKA